MKYSLVNGLQELGKMTAPLSTRMPSSMSMPTRAYRNADNYTSAGALDIAGTAFGVNINNGTNVSALDAGLQTSCTAYYRAVMSSAAADHDQPFDEEVTIGEVEDVAGFPTGGFYEVLANIIGQEIGGDPSDSPVWENEVLPQVDNLTFTFTDWVDTSW